jgi:hypothetical protein
MPDHYTDGSTDGQSGYTDGTASLLAEFLSDITQAAEAEIVHPDDECTGKYCTPHGALRMAAALRKVLELHTRQERPVRSYDLDLRCEAHEWTRRAIRYSSEIHNCPDCAYREYHRCMHDGCREETWPCPTYSAIATALLGESAVTPTHQRRDGAT